MPLCCSDEKLCPRCYARTLKEKSGMATVVGAMWAEREARRRPDIRAKATWPSDHERVRQIAAEKVSSLAVDERMLGELVRVCIAGAAAWWQKRPASYRRS